MPSHWLAPSGSGAFWPWAATAGQPRAGKACLYLGVSFKVRSSPVLLVVMVLLVLHAHAASLALHASAASKFRCEGLPACLGLAIVRLAYAVCYVL